MNENLLTVKEVAEIMDVKPVTIYKKVSEGKLPSIKVGKKVLFKKEDIENIVNDDFEVNDNNVAEHSNSYWMIPRSVRKWVTLQQMIRQDLKNKIIGEKWKGNRKKHKERDKMLQNEGLRGKSKGGFVDNDPGGSRTDVALLRALGLYAVNEKGEIELTYQGRRLIETDDPSSVLTDQIFQFRYPSPYSVSINMDENIDIYPYRFLFRLLTDERLADDGSVYKNDDKVRLSPKEIAEFVIPNAKTDDDLDKVVEMILEYRNSDQSISPSKTMRNIANTFINNIEITGFIERKMRKNSSIWIKDESMMEVLNRLKEDPRKIKYEPGNEWEFQHRLGMDPDKAKFTNPVEKKRRIDIEFQVKYILEDILRNKPLKIEEVKNELIEEISSKSGAPKEKVEKVIKDTLTNRDSYNYFESQFNKYSSSGRAFAEEFEKATAEIFREFAADVKWVGKEGKSPDVTFKLKSKKGIIDCKATSNYNISNDHFNRMTVKKEGYIDNYEGDFVLYVANSFGRNFEKKLKKIKDKSNVKGAGIEADDLLYLLKKIRNNRINNLQDKLLELFQIERKITIADINEVL
jgi:excisionase family DNA binding protein